jgi:hypothetical protein
MQQGTRTYKLLRLALSHRLRATTTCSALRNGDWRNIILFSAAVRPPSAKALVSDRMRRLAELIVAGEAPATLRAQKRSAQLHSENSAHRDFRDGAVFVPR